jgi:prepilin-type processing-associated H-X9-DG protein
MKPMRAWVKWVLGLGLLGFTLEVLFPACGCGARENARRSSCQSNLKQIALGYAQYAQDYDGHSPPVSSGPSKGWVDVLQPYLKSRQLFQCPSGYSPPDDFCSDYFYNRQLQGSSNKTLPFPDETILCGDGYDNSGTNANLSELPFDWKDDEHSPARRHLDMGDYVFADGHAKSIRVGQISTVKPRKTDILIATFALN